MWRRVNSDCLRHDSRRAEARGFYVKTDAYWRCGLPVAALGDVDRTPFASPPLLEFSQLMALTPIINRGQEISS